MVGEPNDVSYKNNKHIAGISIYYFPKDVAVSSQFFMSQRCNMIVLAARLMDPTNCGFHRILLPDIHNL